MRCLYCRDIILFESVWSEWLKRSAPICKNCQEKFQRIEKPACQKCGRPYDPKWFCKKDRCTDCHSLWAKQTDYGGNRSLFLYDEEGRNWMNQFKFRGDAACIHMFTREIQVLWKSIKSHTDLIIPIPLSETRKLERCFNQAEQIANQMNQKKVDTTLLYKHEQEKQSKLSRAERLYRTNPFYSLTACEARVKGKNILLVDDIYTTGITIYQAAEILSAMHPKKINSFTLFRA